MNRKSLIRTGAAARIAMAANRLTVKTVGYLMIVLCAVLTSCHTEYKLEKRNRVYLEKRNRVYLEKRDFILSDSAMKVKPAFIALPAGDVRPKGWLKDWAVFAANGITGHLDEWNVTFEKAWKGFGFEARGADAKTGLGWPLEQGAYWFDGAMRLAYILDDSALMRKVTARLDTVVNSVLEGNGKGKSFIWWHDVDFRKNQFDDWAHSHMGRALVAYYEATGDRRILDAMTKVYSQFEATPVPAVSRNSVSGCCNADPMLDVYMLSGNRQTLDAVLKAANDPKTLEAVQKWSSDEFNTQHGVITYENLRIPAMMYPYTNRPEFLNASDKYIRWLEKYHGLPFGIASSEEFVAGIGSTRCTETCNVTTSAWTFQQMYEITGDGSWGDRIEKVFFNAAPAPVARDYQTMAYFQSPNRIQTMAYYQNPIRIEDVFPAVKPPVGGACTFSPIGYGVVCCVGNLTRVVPNFIMHAWMGTIDGGLAAALYCPSEVNTVVGKGIPVKIITDTEYPFEETVRMSVEMAAASVFPLYLRIPEWCENPEIKVNGEKISGTVQHGFIQVKRTWQTGDRVELHFPMQVEIADGQETPYPRTKYFYSERNRVRPICDKQDISSPFRTVSYGPLLFALPVKDDDPNYQAENQQWNYALTSRDASAVTVTRSPMPSKWSWRIEDAPIRLTVKAQTFDWRPSDVLPLPEAPVAGNGDAEITLVPYGCTKFRISMFPIAQ